MGTEAANGGGRQLNAMEEGEEMVERSQMTHRRRRSKEEYGGEIESEMDGAISIEKVFEGKEVPSWREQLTFRAFVVSFFLSVMFSVIVMKLNLTTGIIPSLNVSAGLLGFFFVKTWTKGLEQFGFLKQPFTRQENTVIQTCVVASYGIAFSGKVTAFAPLLFLFPSFFNIFFPCFWYGVLVRRL